MYAVYVSNAESGDIRVYHLDPASRSLTQVQSVVPGGELMPMALTPERDRLYAARRSEPREVLSFAVDAATGHLRQIGNAPLPHSMAYIQPDRSGRFLFSASFGGNLVAVNAIGADGIALGPLQQLPTAVNAHAIAADPSNRFAFSTCMGGGVVMQWRFDASTGQLSPNDPPTFAPRPTASPRHFVFGPDARLVYLLNELDAAVDVLALDATTGLLRTMQTIGSLPPGFSGEPWASDLHLTPDGRFLYTNERRSSTLAAFRVDAHSGLLSLIGHTPTEEQPRGFNITPDGRFLIAAGQKSPRIRLYEIDPDSGALTVCGDAPAGAGANWVETIVLT
ncbi:MAG: beta-propeller fold lactonase family protein [Proteobacteria bacterium]|nr:beta-propeller fold lactonase family protein [Pseudomonadota bacterium]